MTERNHNLLSRAILSKSSPGLTGGSSSICLDPVVKPRGDRIIILFLLLVSLRWHDRIYAQENYKTAWCATPISKQVEQNYYEMKQILERRTTLKLPEILSENACEPGKSNIWWFEGSAFANFNIEFLKKHISNGGVFIVEGYDKEKESINELNNYSIGLEWENPSKNGMFYRSFYLLQTLDGCIEDKTRVLMHTKKINAKAPVGLLLSSHFLSSGEDCFKDNQDYRIRSFVNIIFSFMTTDYKEDQVHLPEILNRIRNLGA